MTRKQTRLPPPPESAPPTDDESSRIAARPDGFYWVADDGIESALEEGESVAEAEAEIGIAEWVDPETGQPAEEIATRLEDH